MALCFEAFAFTFVPSRARLYHIWGEATQESIEYLAEFYYRQRPLSTLGYQSPAEFEVKAAVA